MKKLLVALISLVMMQNAFADDFAKLKIQISGASHENRYFLCVDSHACLSLQAANKGEVFPIDAGNIGSLYTSDISTLRMYPVALTKSCRVTFKNDQTVTVSGSLTKRANGSVVIDHLSCKVA